MSQRRSWEGSGEFHSTCAEVSQLTRSRSDLASQIRPATEAREQIIQTHFEERKFGLVSNKT